MRRPIPAIPSAIRAVALSCLAAALAANPPAPDLVKRGAYLVDLMGCNHCHTPRKAGPNGPEPDQARLLSGHPESLVLPPAPTLPPGWGYVGSASNTAFSGPWGVTYARNLTPDRDTGLGSWTERDWIRNVRSQRHLGKGRPVLPPMPAGSLSDASDRDLRAIYAYLRSIPAVQNRVPEYVEPPM